MMGRVSGTATIVAGVALAALGILNLVYGDTLLTWQPAPTGAAWRVPYAYLSGLVLLVAGGGVLTRRRWAAILAAAWIGLWVLALHVPQLVAAPSVAALLGVAEASFMALGVVTLAGAGAAWPLAIRSGLGLCMIIFGWSHFAYASFTAQMVPAWLPQRLAIAYLTGAVHAIAGLIVLAGWQARAALLAEAAMMSSFVLLLHVPAVIAAPADRLQLTMLAVATLLTCAAWLAASWPELPRGAAVARAR
jgi:uncharacterized membrane protein YphA (DoxX/SURF4 family)